MAAAIGLGLNVLANEGHMVIDIGGGTTEIAVISYGGIVVHRSIKVAGNYLTQAIKNYFRTEHNLLIGETTAEDIKHAAGSAAITDKDFEGKIVVVKGKNSVTGTPDKASANMPDIREKALTDPINKIIEAIKELLYDTDAEISKDIYDKGI